MDEPQSTRESLLIRLADGHDEQAWCDFVDLYSPVVYGFARRLGLQDADAADIVQEVLQSVAGSLRCYDRQKGLFRNWLMAVVRHQLSVAADQRCEVLARRSCRTLDRRLSVGGRS